MSDETVKGADSAEADPEEVLAGTEESGDPILATADEVAEAAPAEAAPAEEAPVEATPVEEVTASVPEVVVDDIDEPRFDKLQKAEEILRASAPASSFRDVQENTFEKVVHINRCSKVVKGGRRFSFSALVVSGDRDGHVGFGFGKAQEVSECIKKSSEASRKAMIAVNKTENTIPHTVLGEHGGAKVRLIPASPGTGLIAGGGVRAVVEAAGIKDVLAKSMGSNNPANVVKATLDALEKLRSKEQIYAARGKRLPERRAL